MKTDGHVQYNGTWQFYLTKQEGLACEFDDHRTCIARSAEVDAANALEAEKKADAEKAALTHKLKLDAQELDVRIEEEIRREAGRRRHEATRQCGLAKMDAVREADERFADVEQRILADYRELHEKAVKEHDEDLKTATTENIEAQAEIDATDYLTQVREERRAKAS